jgi:hypothetical protein
MYTPHKAMSKTILSAVFNRPGGNTCGDLLPGTSGQHTRSMKLTTKLPSFYTERTQRFNLKKHFQRLNVSQWWHVYSEFWHKQFPSAWLSILQCAIQ